MIEAPISSVSIVLARHRHGIPYPHQVVAVCNRPNQRIYRCVDERHSNVDTKSSGTAITLLNRSQNVLSAILVTQLQYNDSRHNDHVQ